MRLSSSPRGEDDRLAWLPRGPVIQISPRFLATERELATVVEAIATAFADVPQRFTRSRARV